jgi:two-component system, chemotaxis family, protein-glutamate methylesterase/glutaminase
MADDREKSRRLIDDDVEEQASGARSGEASMYTCPDCGGVLWQVDDYPRFSCHIGHEWAADSLVIAKSRILSQAAIEAVRVLREKATLLRQLAVRLGPDSETAARLVEQADEDDEHARLLRSHLVDEAEAASLDTSAELLNRAARELERPPDD